MLFYLKDIALFVYFAKCSVLHSVLFRGIGSLLLSFFIFLSIGFYIINRLHDFHCFQIIRLNGPKSHILKKGTPTMGGIIIILSIIISIVIWCDLSNVYVWCILLTIVAYGFLGLIDDFFKIKRKNTVGLNILCKYGWQSFIALILIVVVHMCQCYIKHIDFFDFFFKKMIFQLDCWVIILAYFTLVGTSNSVNLSDGLDGLAIIPVMCIVSGFIIISLVTSNVCYSNYLNILYVSATKELVIVCSAIIGSGLGFLWFNTYPAQIFMGDTGALALGGTIAVIAIFLHQELLLLVMGSVLVIESLSVILQVFSFKIFKRRIFKMAPIHHHFEIQGYSEPKIVVRFWIISFISVCIGLALFFKIL